MTAAPYTPASYAPVAVFVYRRLAHTRLTMEALLRNAGAGQSHLYLFSDGAATPEAEADVAAVRQYVSSLSGFGSLTLICRSRNFGLAANIIEGVSEILENHDKVIVVEDDLESSPWFLTFMNEALDRFADDLRIGHVHGYMYPLAPLPDVIVTRWVGSWGWGTWARAWQFFEPDGAVLLRNIEKDRSSRAFDMNGRFTRMLKHQVEKRNNSWAIRWYASLFLRGLYAVNAGRSLVRNTGNDASGTHSRADACYDVVPSLSPLSFDSLLSALHEQPYSLPETSEARWKISRYHHSVYGIAGRVKRRFYRLFQTLGAL